MRYVLLVTFLFLGACSQPPPPVQKDNPRAKYVEAVRSFVTGNYPDWTFEGITDDYDCPCDIRLSKDRRTKTVRIDIQEFVREDGERYWAAFKVEPTIDRSEINGPDSADLPDQLPTVY